MKEVVFTAADLCIAGGFAFSSNRLALMQAGQKIEGHSHPYPHWAPLQCGSVLAKELRVIRPGVVVIEDDETITFGDGTEFYVKSSQVYKSIPGVMSKIFVPAHTCHLFEVLETPTYWECWYITRDADGNPTQETWNIPALMTEDIKYAL